MTSKLPDMGVDRSPRAMASFAIFVAAWLSTVGVAGAAPLSAAVTPQVQPPASNVQVTKSASPITAEDTPTVVRDPLHKSDLVVVDRIDRVDYSAAVRYSTDSGQSWHPSSLQAPPESDYPAALALVPHKLYAPSAAFDAKGNLFVEFVTLSGSGNQPDGVWMERSTDGGQSFLPPTSVAGAGSYQVTMAVDPRSGRLFVAWLKAPAFLCVLCFPFFGAPLVISQSADEGATWSTPLPVSDPGLARTGSPALVIDSHGNPSVLYYDYESDQLDWGNLPGTYDGQFRLLLARSTDGGASFHPGSVVDSAIVPPHRFLVYLAEKPAFAIGSNGEIVVSWPDGRSGHAQVLVRTSNDGGTTWTGPSAVDQNASDGQVQDLPTAGIAPDGRVDVLYYDGQESTANVFLASSGDGGHTFPTVTRVSTQPSDLQVGPPGSPYFAQADFGSSISLLSSNDQVVAAWTDTRGGNADNGKQDIDLAALSVVPVGSGPSGLLIGLAIGGGILAAAGIGLLVATRRGNRSQSQRRGPPSSLDAPPPPPPLVPTPGQV